MDHKEISRVIKPYSGEGDIMAWLSKIKLVASLSNVKESELAKLIPMYLEGGALAVYLEMAEDVRLDTTKLRKGLLKAFSDSPFTAFSKLKNLRWAGEPVDIFTSEARKLARESGFEGDALERVVRLALVTGVPEKVSVELQQVESAEEAPVSDLVARARILMAKEIGSGVSAGAVASGGGDDSRFVRQSAIKCWECGGPHPVRYCNNKKEQGRRQERIRCFRCGGSHIMKFCKADQGKDAASCQVELVKGLLNRVPVVELEVDGEKGLALVDTGCSRTMMKRRSQVVKTAETSVLAVDGREVKCLGYTDVSLKIGEEVFNVNVRVMETLVGGVDVILGMDVIEKLGGVTVMRDDIKFGDRSVVGVCAVREKEPDIKDEDFDAWFDGKEWCVKYRWNELGEPKLNNTVGQYKLKLPTEKEEAFEAEVERWISEGILIPWSGEVTGLLPLMAVEQETKGKVRPVLDFRELNHNVSCHTGGDGVDICGEKMREWRQEEGEAELVDLKNAYLQIKVSEELWQHQLVKFKGKVYCLTRLGFGLNVAPKIMSKLLRFVLKKDEKIESGTSSYVDDIYVNKEKVTGKEVVQHLLKNGLTAKEPEALDGGAVLGLKLTKRSDGLLAFGRANDIPEVKDGLTKRELFSICGKLVGHYPVAGWLRATCSYTKRHAGGSSWTDYVGDETRDRMREVVSEVQKNDPVTGMWQVPKVETGIVWTDASDLAMGVMLEIEGVVAEDGTWMRKRDDYNHINVAELEAVLKGVNLAVNWGLKRIIVRTDSETVEGWVKTTLSGERRVKTKGAAEILIKRRLGVLKSLVDELHLDIKVELVTSESNKADVLTRVPRKYKLSTLEEAASASVEEVGEMHRRHHMGVERSWFLAKRMDEDVQKEVVKEVVRRCRECQSINPAPQRHEAGELSVDTDWTRLAIDVVHYRGIPHLSMVDCGPGRFAIWRRMKGETATEICGELEQVFLERGPVAEALLDNSPAFKSSEVEKLLQEWGIEKTFRAAYRPAGNGIVERHHRTIKSMAEKMRKSPVEAVYWYNIAPKEGQRESSVPQKAVHTYEWGLKGDVRRERKEEPECVVKVGDEVWVKPGEGRCTSRWKEGTVTKVNSANNVDVDGMARHILDIRPVVSDGEVEEETEPERVDEDRRYPQRERAPPVWMRDYSQY